MLGMYVEGRKFGDWDSSEIKTEQLDGLLIALDICQVQLKEQRQRMGRLEAFVACDDDCLAIDMVVRASQARQAIDKVLVQLEGEADEQADRGGDAGDRVVATG